MLVDIKMINLKPHRILTTEFGALIALARLKNHGYTKVTLTKSGHSNFPISIELDAPSDENFDFLRPDILPLRNRGR